MSRTNLSSEVDLLAASLEGTDPQPRLLTSSEGKGRGKGSSTKSARKTAQGGKEKEGDESGEERGEESDEEDEEWQIELQARFIRVLHELDYMGFIKHMGKKADHIVKTVYDVYK